MASYYYILFFGILTGLLLSVPIGAANILSLEHTFRSGSLFGFITGSGATFGDFIFVIASLAGVISLNDFQAENLIIIKYFGAFVLIIFSLLGLYKGFKQYHDCNACKNLVDIYKTKGTPKKTNYFSGFIATFILTITNPLTPIAVISTVTTIGLAGNIFTNNYLLTSIFFSFGILFGSLGWWYCLSQIADKFANKLTGRILSFINYFGALIMLFSACYLVFIL